MSLLRGGFEAQHSKFAHGVGAKARQALAEGTRVDPRTSMADAACDVGVPVRAVCELSFGGNINASAFKATTETATA